MEVLDQLAANPVSSRAPTLDTGTETLSGEQEQQLSRRCVRDTHMYRL